MDLTKQFQKVYIEEEALSSLSAKNAFKIFPKNQIHVIKDSKQTPGLLNPKEFNNSKKQLLLKKFKGKFFKRCPGAKPGLLCCNYFVLNLGQHCEMDCSYCYLQSFINFPFVTIYTNIESALEELNQLNMDHQKLRIGTGEITDSLSLDDVSQHSARLIEYFNKKPSWTLEFKTKSANIKNFIESPHKGNVIVSWSMNPEYIITKEEKDTASLKERLKSARLARGKGFPIAFHIDPIIYHTNWRENYSDFIQQITQMFKPQNLAHISLGALRFAPSQKAFMRERLGKNSLIPYGEYFKSADGKLRYDQDLRKEMFSFIHQCFKQASPQWKIFLCMENKENWLSSLKNLPDKTSHLKSYFDFKPVRAFNRNSPL